jgi:dTDP-4-amino-4,6-dideoxygalactose transaminase
VHIPFVNLRLQYESIKDEIDQAINEVFASSQFIGGQSVLQFEKEFAQAAQVKHCIGTGNGTDALYLILKSLGIGPGDEVITPAFSCIASAEIISQVGATTVFADIDPIYHTIEPGEVLKKISSRTKAVIAVHLYGQAAPVHDLRQICHDHRLFLIEDCAQAHFSKAGKQFTGTFGVAAAFSFYPTKNLGAYGDAGCVVTGNDELAEKIKRHSNHGALHRNDHAFPGSNSRLDSLQAAILCRKLKHVPDWNQKRVALANAYSERLKGIKEVKTPETRQGTHHSFHLYAIEAVRRDALKQHLNNKGIDTLIHYPKALPFTDAFSYTNHQPADFPFAFQLQNNVLSLPLYPELSLDQLNFICESIIEFYNN